jgi:hypothetical protein
MPKAFWERDPSLLEKVSTSNQILVSVKSNSQKVGQQLTLQGVGHIKAPVSYVKEWVSHYEHLKRVSEYVIEAKWNDSQKQLFLHTAAFNYHARMNISVREVDASQSRTLSFVILSGVFQGLTGELRVSSVGFQKSQVALLAVHDYKKWILPKLFLEFGLEVVLEKFSKRLRGLIEEDFSTGRWTPKAGIK